MTGEIKVNYAALDQMADALVKAAKKSESALETLLAELRKYDEDFTGAAKNAFQSLESEYTNVTKTLVPELNNLANGITSAGHTFNRTDVKAADGFR